MNIFDITVCIDDNTPTWPGSPGFKREWKKRINDGEVSNDSVFSCSSHAGTHVDAPLHFIENGSSIDAIPLHALCGPAYVAELGSASIIGEEALAASNIPPGAKRILFKTKNSNLWDEMSFDKGFTALSEDGAHWLVRKELMLIGIDYLSIGPYPDGRAVHTTILSAGIVVIEGLNLCHITEGWYDLYCLPLKIKGAEGAPCRAALIPRKSQFRESNNAN